MSTASVRSFGTVVCTVPLFTDFGANPFVTLPSGDQDSFQGQLGYSFVCASTAKPITVRALGRAVNPKVGIRRAWHS